ncbi:MAG: zinc ribbon domain-containing protein [Candidatus Omnitrophica bacterium]|nr:zinc ribbon domain-containing protein [Candidatus Omnitrophota bacterium]
MPTYEYECLTCKHKFEILQSIKEKPITKCPKCSNKVKKLISSTGGFIFKGPGFYATDYKKTNKPSCPKAQQGCSGCSGH